MHKYNKDHLENIKMKFENKTGAEILSAKESSAGKNTHKSRKEKSDWGFSISAVVGFAALAICVGIGITNLDKIKGSSNDDGDTLAAATPTDITEIMEATTADDSATEEKTTEDSINETPTTELSNNDVTTEETDPTMTTSEETMIDPADMANPEVTFDEWPAEYCVPTPGANVVLIDGNFDNGKIGFAEPKGTPAYAINDATVIEVSYNADLGNFVYFDLGDGCIVCYSHLDSISVSAGDTVTKGQTVGAIGNTGRVTGPCLILTFYKQ